MHAHIPAYFLHLTFLLHFALQSVLYSQLGHSSADMGANPLKRLWIGFQVNIHFSERVMELALGAGSVNTCVFIWYSRGSNPDKPSGCS